MAGKVLYVEDEDFFATIIKKKLDDAGIETDVAPDGETALTMVGQHQYQLILLDVILPKMDGFSVLETLQRDPATKDIPVVMLSNQSEDGNRQRAETLGAVAYFVKVNATPNDIVQMVQSHLGG